MISKELLSEVLGVKITKVCDEKEFGHRDNIMQWKYDNTLKLSDGNMVVARDNGHKSMNIYELAHKCKKWALTKGYIVDERGVNIFVLTSDGIDVVWSSYGEPFCPHRVFEPCEWIMEIALRAHKKIERIRSLKDPIDNKMIKIDLEKFTKETLKKTKEQESMFISSVPIENSKLKIYQIISPRGKFHGMNIDEREVMELLKEAWNKFQALDQTHPDHKRDFADGIHKCQEQIIHRVVQRDYPNDFPTYEE